MEQPVAKSLAVGAAAGLFAACIMEAAQAGLARVTDDGKPDDMVTARAGERLAGKLSGHHADAAERRRVGRLVHYVTGAGLGMIYALGAWAAGPPRPRTMEARVVSTVSHLAFGLVLSGAYRAVTRAI